MTGILESIGTFLVNTLGWSRIGDILIGLIRVIEFRLGLLFGPL